MNTDRLINLLAAVALVELMLTIGLGASVSLDLSKTRLTLPVNGGDRIEPLTWLEETPEETTP